jgi:hypothetical protein
MRWGLRKKKAADAVKRLGRDDNIERFYFGAVTPPR